MNQARSSVFRVFSVLRLYWICKCLISCQEIRAKDLHCNSKVSVSPATRRGTIRKSLTHELKLSRGDQICNIDESEVIKRWKCNQENLEAGTRDCDRISWSLLKILWLNLIISLRRAILSSEKKNIISYFFTLAKLVQWRLDSVYDYTQKWWFRTSWIL